MSIFIVGAKCDRCGEAGRDSIDHYLERHNGDRWVSLCKNARLCAERQEANRAAGS